MLLWYTVKKSQQLFTLFWCHSSVFYTVVMNDSLFLCTAASLSLKIDFCVLFSYCTSICGKEIQLTYTQALMGELIHTHTHTRVSQKIQTPASEMFAEAPQFILTGKLQSSSTGEKSKQEEVEGQRLSAHLRLCQPQSLILCQRNLRCPVLSENLFPSSAGAGYPNQCVPPLRRGAAENHWHDSPGSPRPRGHFGTKR